MSTTTAIKRPPIVGAFKDLVKLNQEAGRLTDGLNKPGRKSRESEKLVMTGYRLRESVYNEVRAYAERDGRAVANLIDRIFMPAWEEYKANEGKGKEEQQ